MGRPVIDPLTGELPELPARPSGAAGWSRDLPDHAPTSAGLALFAGLSGSLRPIGARPTGRTPTGSTKSQRTTERVT